MMIRLVGLLICSTLFPASVVSQTTLLSESELDDVYNRAERTLATLEGASARRSELTWIIPKAYRPAPGASEEDLVAQWIRTRSPRARAIHRIGLRSLNGGAAENLLKEKGFAGWLKGPGNPYHLGVYYSILRSIFNPNRRTTFWKEGGPRPEQVYFSTPPDWGWGITHQTTSSGTSLVVCGFSGALTFDRDRQLVRYDLSLDDIPPASLHKSLRIQGRFAEYRFKGGLSLTLPYKVMTVAERREYNDLTPGYDLLVSVIEYSDYTFADGSEPAVTDGEETETKP
jgi:hypothetical protein